MIRLSRSRNSHCRTSRTIAPHYGFWQPAARLMGEGRTQRRQLRGSIKSIPLLAFPIWSIAFLFADLKTLQDLPMAFGRQDYWNSHPSDRQADPSTGYPAA